MKKLILASSLFIGCMLFASKALGQTIPPPTGVSCPSNNSTFVFTAEFDDFDGWTGDLTNNNFGGNWEVPGNADSSGTGPNTAFSGANYMNYESSGGSAPSASTITPVIDLTTATDGAELSFYMHAYGEGMGTLEVGISNSISGPFTNLFTWSGQLQTSGSEPWVPVGINLDAYLGQSIYLEFKHTRTDNFRGDMSIDFVRVETCGTFCVSPTVTVDSINSDATEASVDVSWVANDSETSWEYVVQDEGTGIPIIGTSSIVTNITEGGLLFDTDYEVYVRANCTNGNSIWAGPVLFTTPIQTDFAVDCGVGPLTQSICYGDGGVDIPEVYTFTSTDGTPLTLNFYSGFVEVGFDNLVVFDSNGTFLQGGPGDFFYGNDGDLSGFSYSSIGDTISFYIASDSFGGGSSCQSGTLPFDTGIIVEVACDTCDNSEATYTVVDDCDNGDQFLLDVNVTSLGSATSLTLSNNIDSNTTSVTTTGIYQVGPFPFATDVVYTLSNDQDVNCVLNSLPIRFLDCLPDNDQCENATVASVNTGIDDCTLLTPGTILSATPSNIASGLCQGNPDDDVWFQFTAINNTQIITFENIVENSNSTGLNHAMYEGSCGSLNQLYCSDNIASVTPQLVIGDTYYIRVFSEGNQNEDVTFDLCIRPGINNVVVDQTTYTVDELVRDVLFGSECAQVTNITSSTGFDFPPNDSNGIGYFSMDGPGFPFAEGLLMTTGEAAEAVGPNTSLIDSGSPSWLGDEDLDTFVGVSSENATIIEFDFIPLSDSISFEFLMASEEYNGSSDECNFSDAFAFLLTGPDNNTTNLAVIPGTATPILTTNIHPENPSCPAINEQYFAGYLTPDLPPTSFDGRTVVFTAQSPVIVGQSYHIKLVVADEGDARYDTGIFFKAGSFDIGELSLGDDITIEAGTATCLDEPIILNTQATNLEHVWFKDGILIDGEISSTLIVTEADTYTAQVIISNQCVISDDIVVEFLELPIANQPQDLVGCSEDGFTIFSLPEQTSEILGTQDSNNFTVTYHENEQDAIDGLGPLPDDYENISNPQIVYARVEDNTTGCYATTFFNLVFGVLPNTSFSNDFDYEVCPNATNSIVIEAIPENYSPSEVSISWYRDGALLVGENNLSLPVLVAGLYEVEIMFNDTGCIGVAEQVVTELESCVFPQGISPDLVDGKNDTFDLSSFDVTRLEIFNRNGTLVYSKNNYTNEWIGQTNDGKELPVGTYFYRAIYEGGSKVKTSWIYINR